MPAIEKVTRAASVAARCVSGRLAKWSGRGAEGGTSSRGPYVEVCENFGPKTVRAAMLRSFCSSTRLVLRVTKPPRSLFPADRLVLRQADVIVVDSQSNARAIRRCGFPASRVVFLSDTPDLAMFANASRDRVADGACRLIHVGDLEPKAGAADLMQCVIAWAGANPSRIVEVWWAGDGCLRGILEAQPVPPNVTQRFLGHLSPQEIASAFGQCSVLAVPTFVDQWSHVVVEAMVAGLPVLGSRRCRAVEEMVVHGETGWVFDPYRQDEMARAVALALDAVPEALERMRATASARWQSAMRPRLEERIGKALHLHLPDGLFERRGRGVVGPNGVTSANAG